MSSDASGSPNQLTIEQLAAESGMSVRNIRSHQARGLLAAPEVRLRVGYYGSEHVTQLRRIRDLQDEGFNLNGIKRLLDDRHGTAESLLAFKDAVTGPLHVEPGERLTLAELGEKFPLLAEEVVQRGISLEGALAILEQIERHCDSVSRSFVNLFLVEMFKPFQQAERPAELRPEIEQAIERLRPIASEALLTIFQQRMSTQIELAFGEITPRRSEPRR